MAARAAHRRYVIDEPASPEATQRLFGISDDRAATLARYVAEALETAEQGPGAPKGRARGRARKAR